MLHGSSTTWFQTSRHCCAKVEFNSISWVRHGSSTTFETGLIFGGAYLRREINCVSKSIGVALQLEGNLTFLLCFTLFPSTSLRGACIWRGDLTEGFLCYEFGGLIHGGAYFRNVTVRYINLLGRCSKEKPRARAPGSNFLSLSNACYAGYIYLFITYLFRLYLVCFIFLYLCLLIIPLSLFL